MCPSKQWWGTGWLITLTSISSTHNFTVTVDLRMPDWLESLWMLVSAPHSSKSIFHENTTYKKGWVFRHSRKTVIAHGPLLSSANIMAVESVRPEASFLCNSAKGFSLRYLSKAYACVSSLFQDFTSCSDSYVLQWTDWWTDWHERERHLWHREERIEKNGSLGQGAWTNGKEKQNKT